MTDFEHVPDEEADRIANTVKLTLDRLDKRFPGITPVRRGVHPKDHGCVTALFKVDDLLAEEFRVDVFANPGREFDALIRFSNADVDPKKSDSNVDAAGTVGHGSRGMAVKLLGVSGAALMTTKGPLTQGFLMINQPVFAFANVEDYEALSQVLLANNDVPDGFFARLRSPDPVVRQRAQRTLGIIQRIKSNSSTPTPTVPPAPPAAAAFQEPPGTPVDNRYFSAVAFLFGDDQVMKYSARPVHYPPVPGQAPDFSDPNYLRTGLRNRLAPDQDEPQNIVFEFQLQVRSMESLAGKIDTEIEDVCIAWDEKQHPFKTVATITIPPQNFNSVERRALCEDLIFSPWNGLAEHRPIGGINRLRRAVYLASSQFRHAQPSGFLSVSICQYRPQ